MERVPRLINNEKDINYFLNMTEEDGCRLSFIMDNFCPFGDKPAKFQPFDILIVPANAYGPPGRKNKAPFTTTLGRWIYNKVFIEKELFDIFHYVNETLDKDTFEGLNVSLSYAVIEDKISLDALKHYVFKTQKFQPYCNVLCPSLTEEAMLVPKKIRDLKEQLFKKYQKELDNNDPITSQKIEKELLDEARKILKNDEFLDLINSNARMTWGNNFKNTFIFRGAVKDPDPTSSGYAIIKSNFADGMGRHDYATFANSFVEGPYSRNKKTEIGGAWEKMFVRALQHLKVLEPGSDCGTDRCLTLTLTKKNIKNWMYSYVKEGNKLVEITTDNRDKYIGKTVKLRYSALCESKEGICNKCAGNLFHRINLVEVGIASYQICSILKNKAMKAFHDGTVKVSDLEEYGLNKIFGVK